MHVENIISSFWSVFCSGLGINKCEKHRQQKETKSDKCGKYQDELNNLYLPDMMALPLSGMARNQRMGFLADAAAKYKKDVIDNGEPDTDQADCQFYR